MLNGNMAEWILSLVTTRDRASATVGDLIESRVSAWRFWSAVGSQVFRGLTGRAYALAIAAFLAQFVFLAVPALAVAYVQPRPSVFWWAADLACLSATQIVVGRWIARHGKAQALGICLIVVVIDCVLGAAIWSIPLFAGTLAAAKADRKSVRRA